MPALNKENLEKYLSSLYKVNVIITSINEIGREGTEELKGFAIWITGLPAPGKTAVAEGIKRRLEELYEIKAEHLESDTLRKVLTPEPSYSVAEREWFYGVSTS